MSTMNQIASDLYKALSESNDKKVKPYDVKATVLREEGNVVWVKIPGGVDETPVRKTNNANPGDDVMVRIANGRAWVLGNETSPATDNTMASAATQLAEGAGNLAQSASDSAAEAQRDAQIAYYYAEDAHTAANNAWDYADSAHNAADQANTAANASLTQLGVVEDVVGVLNWISTHATYKVTADTEVVEGKWYFTRSGDNYNIVVNPTGNPSSNGWYEIDSIDEAVSNYVSSHLALTNQGLWVVNDNSSYKILLASDGMKVYDASGNLVSTFGESITFSSNRVQYIGGENAYIIFNPVDGSMIMGGSRLNISGNISIGGQSRSLSDVLSDMQSGIAGSIKIVEYASGTSPTIAPSSGWSTDSPEWEEGKYVWMRQSKDGINYTYTCIQGAKGEQGGAGAQGPTGPQGDEGDPAILVVITGDTTLRNNSGSTTLTASVYVGGAPATVASNGTVTYGGSTIGTIKWYKGTATTGTAASTCSVSASDVTNSLVVYAKLEA